MCGLVGVMSKHMSQANFRLAGMLQLLNQLRGMHSTGVAVGYHDGKIELVKSVGGFEKLIESEPQTFDGLRYMPMTKKVEVVVGGKPGFRYDTLPTHFYMGHGRYATIGEIDEENAHPFQFSNIVGVHNGTFEKQFYTKLDTYRDDRSDSFAVLSKINQISSEDISDEEYEDKMTSFLKSLKGAYALIWWDMDREQMNFYRNHERTLFLCAASASQVLCWASEEWMLKVSLEKMSKIFNPDIKSLSTRTWVSINFGASNKLEVGREVTVPFEVVRIHNHSSHRDGYEEYWNSWDAWEDEVQDKGNVTIAYASSFNGVFIPRKEWEERTKGGCAICQVDLDIVDHRTIGWYDRDTPLCKDCSAEFQDELKVVN